MAKRRLVIRFAPVLLLAVLAGGCRDPLLSDREPRSQYDRYDIVRNQYVPQYVTDPYGGSKPNLRARLAPRE